MVFSSLQFVLLFMPIFFTCFYLVPDRWKNIILLLGSFTFYYVGTTQAPVHFLLLIMSIIVDFLVGLGMEKRNDLKKPLLTAGVLFHLISLCIFKYSNFICAELVKAFPDFPIVTEMILPVGISFYTFQGLSYIADVYRGKEKAEKSLLRFAVYISMFEQLIAGPIVTYGQVRKELKSRSITVRDAISGMEIFTFGLGLKVLLANPIWKLWSQTLAIGFDCISTPLAWMAVLAYSFHIYFDFFGYSLMAIGLGKMLGFRLPKNFDHPYISLTMTEFWRRWHITLGSWFREYVYIPLGGNRCGTARTLLNLLIVWLLTGIWHGAGYNFILWGFLLFVIIMIEKLFIGRYLSEHAFLGHIYMMILIPLTWAVFAVSDMDQLRLLFTRLFPFFGQGMWSIFRYDYLKYLGQYYPFFIAGILFSTKLPYRLLERIKKPAVTFLLTLAILIASLYCMYRGFDDPFLYFRF